MSDPVMDQTTPVSANGNDPVVDGAGALRARRRLLKAGALLAPAVITLRAGTAQAATYTDPMNLYKYGTHAGRYRIEGSNPVRFKDPVSGNCYNIGGAQVNCPP